MKDLKQLIACLKATEYDDLDACHAAAYLEQLERLTSGDVALPPHPEAQLFRWSRLERAAIEEYGARCREAEKERILNLPQLDGNLAIIRAVRIAICKGEAG